MAWIELHQSIWTHKKTLILATELNLEEIYAAAHMAKLWTWALDNAQDGYLIGLPYKVIAYGAGWQKEPDVFVRALINAGWLDETDSGLYIHDWEEYAGKLMERRAAERERSRRRRAESKSLQTRTSDEKETTGGRPADDQQTAVGTVPNRTLPISSNSNNNARAREGCQEESLKETAANIYTIFEKEFGRPLTPIEFEKINNWLTGHQEFIIREGLKRAVLAGKLTFRYIDTILLEWKKNNIRTIQEIEQREADFKNKKGEMKSGGKPPREPTADEQNHRTSNDEFWNKYLHKSGA